MPDNPFDWATFFAAVIAALASLYAVHITRKTTFINTITSERIRWMDDFRRTVSKICGLTYYWSLTGRHTPQSEEIIKEIDSHMHLVKLQLNRTKKEHEKILTLIEGLLQYTGIDRIDKLERQIDKIIELSQDLLTYEWGEVKREAKEGDLSKEECWCIRMVKSLWKMICRKKDTGS